MGYQFSYIILYANCLYLAVFDLLKQEFHMFQLNAHCGLLNIVTNVVHRGLFFFFNFLFLWSGPLSLLNHP